MSRIELVTTERKIRNNVVAEGQGHDTSYRERRRQTNLNFLRARVSDNAKLVDPPQHRLLQHAIADTA